MKTPCLHRYIETGDALETGSNSGRPYTRCTKCGKIWTEQLSVIVQQLQRITGRK